MKLTEILRDSNYKLTQFTTEQVETLEKTSF
jgi:type I restriction enzyme M protein